MAVSTAPAVVTALLTLLDADTPGLDGVEVTRNPINVEETAREFVRVGQVTWQGEEWAQIGKREREETFDVELEVASFTPGQTAGEAADRAAAMWERVETVLRNTPALGVSGSNVRHLLVAVQPREWRVTGVGDGFVASWWGVVRCQARTVIGA